MTTTWSRPQYAHDAKSRCQNKSGSIPAQTSSGSDRYKSFCLHALGSTTLASIQAMMGIYVFGYWVKPASRPSQDISKAPDGTYSTQDHHQTMSSSRASPAGISSCEVTLPSAHGPRVINVSLDQLRQSINSPSLQPGHNGLALASSQATMGNISSKEMIKGPACLRATSRATAVP